MRLQVGRNRSRVIVRFQLTDYFAEIVLVWFEVILVFRPAAWQRDHLQHMDELKQQGWTIPKKRCSGEEDD